MSTTEQETLLTLIAQMDSLIERESPSSSGRERARARASSFRAMRNESGDGRSERSEKRAREGGERRRWNGKPMEEEDGLELV